jgi:hypothetical protein
MRRSGSSQGECAVNRLKRLEACGQPPWLDYLKHSVIEKGELRTLIERDGLEGVTSNPSIFEKAIGETDEHAGALNKFQAETDHSISAIYAHLAIADVRAAADVLRPVYEQTHGPGGYISLECSPYLANAREGSAAEGIRRLRPGSGEGRWTVETAIGSPGRCAFHGALCPLPLAAGAQFGEKMLSAMRFGFGGHIEGNESIVPDTKPKKLQGRSAAQNAAE